MDTPPKYLSTIFSSILVGLSIVALIFGVYACTHYVTDALQKMFGLGLQETISAAQAFEMVGRVAVSVSVIWLLSTAITAMPKISFNSLRHLFAERGAMLALVIASIMTAAMQHRIYWWLHEMTNPASGSEHNALEAAVNSNMVGSLSILMVFILFYEKEKLAKPFWISLATTVVGVITYWYTISVM